jgi:hypothetical protein
MKVISTASLSTGHMHGPDMKAVLVSRTSSFMVRSTYEFLGPHIEALIVSVFRYSILPVLSLDSILHLKVLDHSFTGEEFLDFIQGVLDQMQLWPLPNSVLVMDNASIHHVPGIHEMVKERCVTAWPN